MKPLVLILMLCLVGCSPSRPIESGIADPAVGRTSSYQVRPSPEEISELDHVVVDEGDQLWRFDADRVAENAMQDHLEESEHNLQVTTQALYNIKRRGANAVVKIQWQQKIVAEVFLENTRPNGGGCWFADHLTITRFP